MSAENEPLKLAELQLVSLELLDNGDQEEAEKLFAACKTSGFFYLDLNGAVSGQVQSLIHGMFQLNESLFQLPKELLEKYDVDKLHPLKLNGFKPIGRNFGGLDGKDGFETYAIPKNGILGTDASFNFQYPSLLHEHLPALRAFTRTITHAAQVLFRRLSASLGLPATHALEALHRPNAASPDIARLLRYAPQPPAARGAPHTAHTDLGSLTFLFTREPGLQILAPGSDAWAFVPPPPRPGCAVVNLGDAMALFTNGLFHSCLHRVGPLPGRAMPARASVAYLMRAEDEVRLEALPGREVPAEARHRLRQGLTSREWIERKFGNFRVETRKADDDWTTTGAREGLPP